MRFCCLKSCPNNREVGYCTASVHALSKHESDEVKKAWRDFCKSSNKEISICANHFTRDNFTVSEEDINHRMRRRLKRGAVPTIIGPVVDSNPKPKKVKDEDISSASEDDAEFLRCPESSCSESETNDIQEEILDYKEPDTEYFPEEAEYLEYDSDMELDDANENLDEKDLKILKLERTVKKLKERQWNPTEDEIFQLMKTRLAGYLTENQLNFVLKRKKRVTWNRKELSRAFGLRSFGCRTYNYVRKVLKYPIPAPRCLRRWARLIDVDDEENPRVAEILAVLQKKTKLKSR